MNEIWSLSLDDYLEICERAKKNGKNPGDSMEEELRLFMKEKNREPIAHTKDNIDILTGNLREEGIKVLNMNEIQRRKDNE